MLRHVEIATGSPKAFSHRVQVVVCIGAGLQAEVARLQEACVCVCVCVYVCVCVCVCARVCVAQAYVRAIPFLS